MAGFREFRSQAVEAYEAGPRGARPIGDIADSAGIVDAMRPRWRPAVLAALALIVVAVGGFAVRVPLGAVGVVVSAQAVTAVGPSAADGAAHGPITGIALTEQEPGLTVGTIVRWRSTGATPANGTSPDSTDGADGGSAEVVGWGTVDATPVVLVAPILDAGPGALPGDSPAAFPPGTPVTLTFGGTSLLADLVGWSS